MSVKQIYLHAGLNKTGSTSIQRAMFNNRDRLRAAGVSYWNIGANHSLPIRMMFEQLDVADNSAWPGHGIGEHRKYRSGDKVREHLRNALSKSEAKFVISGEAIWRVSEPDLARLKAMLHEFSPRISIIIYVRDPRSLYHSMVQQRLKNGRTLDQLLVAPFAYRSRVEKFFSVFGRENVFLRPFQPAQFVNSDLLADFFAVLGEPLELAAAVSVGHRNASLSQRAAYILDAVNRAARQDSVTPYFPWLIERFLRPYFPGKPFRAPRDAVERMLDMHRTDIEWMSSQMGVDLLAAAPTDTDPDPPPSAIDEDIGRLIYLLSAEISTLQGLEFKLPSQPNRSRQAA